MSADSRTGGDIKVFGSNGPVGTHNEANTGSPVIVVGRKGSHGKLQYSEERVFAIDTTYFVDPSTTDHHLKWLFYVLQIADLDTLGHDVGVPGLNREIAYSVRLPTPPPRQQQAIADFLDAETARIDALIAKKGHLVQLLDERWRSMVDRLTSRGTPIRVRHLTSLITSGPRGWADRVGESGDPFVRSANLTRNTVELRLDDLARVNGPDNHEAERSRLTGGDVVIGITGANTGWVGLVGPELRGGFVSQHVAIVRPAQVLPRWLALSLFSQRIQDDLVARQYGGTKQQLGLQDLAELIVHVPSDSDQEVLVAMLSDQDRRRTQVQTRLTRQIGLLAERRQALITAAVTGELDVAESIAEEAS